MNLVGETSWTPYSNTWSKRVRDCPSSSLPPSLPSSLPYSLSSSLPYSLFLFPPLLYHCII